MRFLSTDEQREKFEENYGAFDTAEEYKTAKYVLLNADDSKGKFKNVCKVLLKYWQAIQVIESISNFLEVHPELNDSLHDYICKAHIVKKDKDGSGLDVFDVYTLGTKTLPPLDAAVMTRIEELSELYHELKVTRCDANQRGIQQWASHMQISLKEAFNKDVMEDRLELRRVYDRGDEEVSIASMIENSFFLSFFDTQNTEIRLYNFKGAEGDRRVGKLAEDILLLARKTCHDIAFNPYFAVSEAHLLTESYTRFSDERYKESQRVLAEEWEAACKRACEEAELTSTVEHASSDGGQAADYSGLAAGGVATHQ